MIINQFQGNIISLYGNSWKKGLGDLPRIVDQISVKWQLSDLKPVENLSYNYVLSGFQSDKPIILKLGINAADIKREAEVLKAFEDFGAVKVLADLNGIILLERAISATSLKSYFPLQEEKAIKITCDVMRKLHKAPFPNFKLPNITDWLEALDKSVNIPSEILLNARNFRDKLLKTSDKVVLLHGDLHHDNILVNGDSFQVIDPKGVIGEQAYEVAAFIRNPMPELLLQPNTQDIVDSRIRKFARELSIDQERIRNWCFVQSVLCWIWAIEDGGDVEYFTKITYLINEIGGR